MTVKIITHFSSKEDICSFVSSLSGDRPVILVETSPDWFEITVEDRILRKFRVRKKGSKYFLLRITSLEPKRKKND